MRRCTKSHKNVDILYESLSRPSSLFATVWLGDRRCGQELQQCRARLGALVDRWEDCTRCLMANEKMCAGKIRIWADGQTEYG